MSKLLNKKTVKNIEKFLNQVDEKSSIIELKETARSSKDAANSLNVPIGAIVKSIIVKSFNNEYYICLVSGNKTISMQKLSMIIKVNISKANADEIKRVTGYSIGGVPPFAHIYELPTYIDFNLKNYKNIYAAAGHPHCIFKTNFEKIVKFTKGYVCDFTD